jgi:hypothetical protein
MMLIRVHIRKWPNWKNRTLLVTMAWLAGFLPLNATEKDTRGLWIDFLAVTELSCSVCLFPSALVGKSS